MARHDVTDETGRPRPAGPRRQRLLLLLNAVLAAVAGCSGPSSLPAPAGEPWLDLVASRGWAVAVGEPVVDTESGVILLPPGASLSWALPAFEGVSLRADGLVLEGDVELHVTSEVDGRRAETTRLSRSDREPVIPLTSQAGEPVRVTLTADGDGEGVVLRSPRLWGSLPSTAPESTAPLEAQPAPGTQVGQVPRVNVLVYLIDTLRRDRLGAYGYERPISPHIDAFAARATLFTDAVAQSTWTKPSVASMFTGVWPPAHGATGWKHRLPDDMAIVPAALQEAGYRTAAVVTNPNIVSDFGFARGFDDFSRILKRPSPQVNEVAFEWLDNRTDDTPFFLYLHTMDPHAPYAPPEPWLSRFAPRTDEMPTWTPRWRWPLEAKPFLLDLYDAEIAFNDDSFGALLRRLEELGVYDDTLIVLVSDHGEEFKDHGKWRHGSNLLPATLHVPLIVKFPRQREGETVHDTVQHSDVAATIFEAAGLEVPAIDGRSLRGGVSAAPVFSHLRLSGGPLQHSVIAGPWKLIRQVEEESEALFLFRRDEDPGEVNDLFAELPVRAAAMNAWITQRLMEPKTAAPAEEVPLSPEIEETMRALGYLQ